jgi:hypothetical protein
VIFTAAALRALPWGRIVPALLLLVAVGAGIAWHVHRVDTARAEGLARGRSEGKGKLDDAIIAAQSRAAQVEAQRRATEQQREAEARKEIENAQQATEMARSDADRARTDVDRLRVAARATASRCGPGAGNPAAPSGGASAAGAGDLLADVLGRLGEAGAELATEADRRGIAGAACERIYDGMTVKP